METRVFEAKLEYLHDMLDFIKAYCSIQAFAPHFVEQVILAAEEALVNIISYSYHHRDKGFIDLSCGKPDRNGIKIIIRDRGTPFNPLEHIPPVVPPVERLLEKKENPLGGYGIYILTEIMNAVEYQRINDQNVLTLTKYC